MSERGNTMRRHAGLDPASTLFPHWSASGGGPRINSGMTACENKCRSPKRKKRQRSAPLFPPIGRRTFRTFGTFRGRDMLFTAAAGPYSSRQKETPNR